MSIRKITVFYEGYDKDLDQKIIDFIAAIGDYEMDSGYGFGERTLEFYLVEDDSTVSTNY